MPEKAREVPFMSKLALHWQILIAIFLAIVAGLATDSDFQILGVSFIAVYQFIGLAAVSLYQLINKA